MILILTLDLIKLQILLIGKKNVIELKKRIIKKHNFIEFFNNTINKKTILIFESRNFHNECTPGYTKYFIDLGYNVDILMQYQGIDSFSYFNDNNENIRMFLYNKLREIKKRKKFNLSIKKYDYILLETFFEEEKKLFKELHLYNNNKYIKKGKRLIFSLIQFLFFMRLSFLINILQNQNISIKIEYGL